MKRPRWLLSTAALVALVALATVSCLGKPEEPTPTPTVERLTPVQVEVGQQVEVLVEPGAVSESGLCVDLLPYMVTASQVDSVHGEPLSCTVGRTERSRLQFVRDAAGVLYLLKIELLLLYAGDVPRSPGGPGTRSCADIVQYLLPAAAEIGIPGHIVCWFDPLPRGHTHTETIRVWGVVPPDGPTGPIPEDIHCWELVPFVGPPIDRIGREGATYAYVPCILN